MGVKTVGEAANPSQIHILDSMLPVHLPLSEVLCLLALHGPATLHGTGMAGDVFTRTANVGLTTSSRLGN